MEGAPTMMEIVLDGIDGITVRYPEFQLACKGRFDGKDYTVTGAGADTKQTLTFETITPNSIRMTTKLSDKPLYVDVLTLSTDAKSLTDDGNPVSVKQPMKAVYERQEATLKQHEGPLSQGLILRLLLLTRSPLMRCRMRHAGLPLVAGVVLVGAVLGAAVVAQTSGSPDERAIRDAITRFDRDPKNMATSDLIFWSGAFRRPTIGKERAEEVKGEGQISNRVPNSQRTTTTPVRIEVAKSSDLAYEFSNSEVSFDLKDGRHVTLHPAVLRVWRKESGQWKIAAHFARPIEQELAK